MYKEHAQDLISGHFPIVYNTQNITPWTLFAFILHIYFSAEVNNPFSITIRGSLVFQISIPVGPICASRGVCGQPGQPTARLETANRYITSTIEYISTTAAVQQFTCGIL